MDKDTVTIKDIANALNVSTTTVHKAIHGKKGINEKTRRAVLDYMDRKGFRPNRAAAALKRRPIRLACVLVEPSELSRFFYTDILTGIRNALTELEAFHVETSIHFSPLSMAEQTVVLERLLQEDADSLNGLLITPTHEQKLNDIIRRFTEKGIAVVTLNSDTISGSRQANVSSDNTMAGQVAAELLCAFLGETESGNILLLGGNRNLYNHHEATRGFFSIMEELRPDFDIFECYEFENVPRLEKQIQTYLEKFDDIRGIYCNNARNTFTMCSVIHRLGFSKKLKVIGSDVHAELLPYFEDGTLNAAIYQDPRTQGYKGLWNLYFLVTGEEKVPEITKTNIGIVIRSNVEGYLQN
ncbi:transcriptional regulator [Spirochaetia bacterium]|nr:transcriptional regulator [Spirochaetia bacterium]